MSKLGSTRGIFARVRYALTWLILLCIVVSAVAVGPTRAVAQSETAISTQDGLRLGLTGDGGIAEIGIRGRTLPKLASPGGFSMRMVGRNQTELTNGSLEQDTNGDGIPDGWRYTAGATRPRLVDTVAHTGRRSIRLSNRAVSTSGGVSTRIAARPYTYYFASVWFRSESVLPTSTEVGDPPSTRPTGSPIQMRVEELSTTDEVSSTYYAFGYTNTAPWNKQAIGFKTNGTTRALRVTALLRSGSGTAWVDDIHVGRTFADTSLPVRGTVRQDDAGTLRQHAEIPSQPLTFDAVYTPRNGHIQVDAVVTSQANRSSVGSDRAFQITYSLPVNAVGWQWGDYARQARSIQRGIPYKFNTKQTPEPSRYPFAAVYDDRSSLTLGMPLNVPRLSRTRYDSKQGLQITFDLGVSRAATKLGGKANFSFIIYTSDPAWGFRAATKKYYNIYPDHFVRRTEPEREGTWFIRPTLSELDNPDTVQDESKPYGLGLHMVSLGAESTRYDIWGLDYLAWSNKRNIYTSAYNSQWRFFLPRCAEGQLNCSPPSYQEATAKLRAAANLTPTSYLQRKLRDEAQGILNSGSRDMNGRLRYDDFVTPYAAFLRFYPNPDPDFSKSIDWVTAVQRHQIEHPIALARSVGGRLDGIHLDSTSGLRRWGDDYGRDHWASANIPLTFSYHSGQVIQRVVFSMYEQIKRTAEYLHDRDMILSANFNANEALAGGYIGADQIDYFTVEEGLPRWNGSAWGVTIDSFAMLKRTMSYQRPLSTIDTQIDNNTLPIEKIDPRLQQSLFYGIFAGARGQDLPVKSWLADRIRRLYAQYTHIFKDITAAGWEPVTHARSSNPNVWVERFGYSARNNLQYTTRNETTVPHQYTLTINLNTDGSGPVRSVRAIERIGRKTVPVSLDASGKRARITTTIAPDTTQVLRLYLERGSEAAPALLTRRIGFPVLE